MMQTADRVILTAADAAVTTGSASLEAQNAAFVAGVTLVFADELELAVEAWMIGTAWNYFFSAFAV